MKIEHKKLIAREILWFVGFLLIAILYGELLRIYEGSAKDLFWILILLVPLYLLRAVVWAIKITFFSKKN